MALPVPSAASAAKTQKMMPSHFQFFPKPFLNSNTWGRYPVSVLVPLPELHRQKHLGILGGHTNQAVTHSQNSVPGPPKVTAVVIPAMFPVPTVPANAVETA